MGARPSGTVTFLFTDIQGSTRLWDDAPDTMGEALAAHDQVLRAAVEAGGGWLFKHTGDGVCAAFSSASDAVGAAVEAQRQLGLPVRMGVVTGSAELRGDDYFGPVLNRAARVMAAAHGGQILLSGATAALLNGADFRDLGMHRLRDLSGVEHLFQVHAEGLRPAFPALRTIDAIPGNLPFQATSFVGRGLEMKQLVELIGAHRLVTLTGVGGVGKTRLALQVGAALSGDFPEGVWLVELATIGDPAAVPDVIAATLGVTPHTGRSVTASIVDALSGRRMLILLDNCEHVLDAVAEVVEAVLAGTASVTVVATSREGLRVGAEQLWPVPSLEVEAGESSEAVDLFVERARAVHPGFSFDEAADVEAVTVVCRRLDGIALAIELAAARMVSMTPQEVRDRLDDRFRLLAGGRRGRGRHQTLRDAVAWSHDLLNDNEKSVLGRCAVFADGFDLSAATSICDSLDEYAVLDVLDSLVRKSLVTARRSGGHVRYGLLETIRQFAEEQLAATDDIAAIRDRHARYYAAQAVAYWEIWDGPRMRVAVDWVDTEFANLRTGFRWAADHQALDTAAAIAAHTTMNAWVLQRYESVGWAVEVLEAAAGADVRQLPRLYTAASLCVYIGQPHDAVRYAEKAHELQADARYDPFPPVVATMWGAVGYMFTGRVDLGLNIWADMANDTRPGLSRTIGGALLTWLLPAVGRAEEARTIADQALATTVTYGNPAWIALAFAGQGRAFADTDPQRSLNAFRHGLEHAREQRLTFHEVLIALDAAGLEAVHGDMDQALRLFDFCLDAFQRAGDAQSLGAGLAYLALFLERIGSPEAAATLYGAATGSGGIFFVVGLSDLIVHLRRVLGEPVFDARVATGAAMDAGGAVAYGRLHIRRARQSLALA